MQPRLRFVLVLSALVFALAIGALADESNVRIVRLSYVNGQVQLDRDGDSGLDDAFLNMPLANGAELVTQEDGYAEVEFEAGTTVRLVPNSDLHFRRLGLDDGNKLSVLELMGGTAYFNVRHEGHDEFHVLINGQDLLVPKSSRFRVVMRQDDAQVSVLSGELRLLGDQELKIRKNQTLSFDFRGQGSPFLSDSVDTLAYDSWNQEREGYTGRFVSSGSYLGYSSGFSYGWNDLNYFGSFFDVPGYGSCWRPYGYDNSWDPYMDGAWVWYPGWGYTWVSGYPWGWAPYRYGRWIWIGGYGWVWQPGHRWNTWYAYAPVYNPPYNYHRQLPPAQPPIVVAHGPGTGGGVHPTPGGPRAGGPIVTAGGRENGVIVVGHGPFTGHGAFTGGAVGVAHGGGASGATGGQVATGRTLPGVITPGVVPNREAVLEQLRRVHGDDLGVRGNVGARGPTMTSGGTTAVGTTGVQTQTQTGATTTVGTTTTVPQQPRVITMPPRPQIDGSGAGNAHEQIEVHQPQVQAQPQQPQPHVNPTVVTPPPQYHPQQQSTPPPSSSPQSSGSSGGGSHSHWGGSSSGASSSSGSHGGSPGGSSGGGHSGYSGGSSNSGGSHSSGSSSSSSGHSSGSSQSSGSHDPK